MFVVGKDVNVVEESFHYTDSLFALVAFLPFITFLLIIALVIWFAIALIKTLKEKNRILQEISNGINGGNNIDS